MPWRESAEGQIRRSGVHDGRALARWHTTANTIDQRRSSAAKLGCSPAAAWLIGSACLAAQPSPQPMRSLKWARATLGSLRLVSTKRHRLRVNHLAWQRLALKPVRSANSSPVKNRSDIAGLLSRGRAGLEALPQSINLVGEQHVAWLEAQQHSFKHRPICGAACRLLVNLLGDTIAA